MKKYITDYPIKGNEAHVFIEVDVVAYDRDKYVAVTYNGHTEWIKRGYVKIQYGNGKECFLKRNFLFTLPCEVGLPKPTRLQVSQEKKEYLKQTFGTSYDVYEYDKPYPSNTKRHKQLSSAIKDFISKSLMGKKLELGVTSRCKAKGFTMFEVGAMIGFDETNTLVYYSGFKKTRSKGDMSLKNWNYISNRIKNVKKK